MSSAQPAPRPWTYADLVALPDDQLRHELIDGEHFGTPSPATGHQIILMNLIRLLLPYLDEHRLGQLLSAPFDIKLSLFTVLVPDLVYFTAERFVRVVNEKHAIAAPDLVVEILSPGTRRRDKGRKRAVYDREGVGEYLDRRPGIAVDHGAPPAARGCWPDGCGDTDPRRGRDTRLPPLPRTSNSPARRLSRPLTARPVALKSSSPAKNSCNPVQPPAGRSGQPVGQPANFLAGLQIPPKRPVSA